MNVGSYEMQNFLSSSFFRFHVFLTFLYFIFRVFNPLKLQHIVTLPKPHFLGVNIAEGMDLRYMFFHVASFNLI